MSHPISFRRPGHSCAGRGLPMAWVISRISLVKGLVLLPNMQCLISYLLLWLMSKGCGWEANAALQWQLSAYSLASCCSVTQLCPTLCDPWTAAHQASLSFTVSHSLFISCPLSQWCHPTILSFVTHFSSCPQSFPASGSFPMSQLFASGGQIIGISTSASVLPRSIQGWFPLGLTGLISLQFKRLLRVFSNTTIQKHQFFGAQHSLWSNSHIHTLLLEKL